LRFDKTLREPMVWAYETFGEKVYTELAKHEKEITIGAKKMS
jgi:type I restriction enzyme M protein